MCNLAATLVGVTCTVGTLNGNGTATITLNASSSATSHPALPRNPYFGGGWVASLALLCLLLTVLPRLRRCGAWAQGQRRRPLHAGLRREAALGTPLRHIALGAALAALLAASLSCGGGGGGTGPTSPPESGTVTVTGTSNSTTHTAQISVSVS